MTQERLSHAAETKVPRIKYDITRRHGRRGCRFLKPALHAEIAEPQKTIVTPDGIIRTTLQNYESAGNEFELVLTTYPPGVGLPLRRFANGL